MFSTRFSKFSLFVFALLAVGLAVLFSAGHTASAASLPMSDRVCIENSPQLQCLTPYDPSPATGSNSDPGVTAPASVSATLPPVANTPLSAAGKVCAPPHSSPKVKASYVCFPLS